jgi:hypothetical protein
VTALAALTRAAEWASPEKDDVYHRVERTAEGPTDLASRCPAGTLPDANVCVPLPAAVTTDSAARHGQGLGGPEPRVVPRRPDRPADVRRYRWPVALTAAGLELVAPSPPGPTPQPHVAGGALIVQAPGEPVRLVSLEHQTGAAHVWYTGKLLGQSVVTHHVVQRAAERRDYLVIHGNLAAPAPELSRGAELGAGSILGRVADSAHSDRVGLLLQIRQVRSTVDLSRLQPSRITDDAWSIAVDPRNVLPLLP